MDRVTGIIRYQWRAYWRRFSRARSLTTGHQGITLIITAVIFFKYLSLLRSASGDLASGNTGLVQALLAGLFLAWVFLPTSVSLAGIPIRRLAHLPLSLRELFAIRIASLVITPFSWIVIAASLAMTYPLARAASPLVAITAALLLLTMACLLGLALAHLLAIATWRRLLFVLLPLTALIIYQLSSQEPMRLLQAFSFPVDLVTAAALRKKGLIAVAFLLALNVLALGAAMWSFQISLANHHPRGSRRKTSSLLFNLPGATGRLAAKDVRYFKTLLDTYFGISISALGCLYLVSSTSPSTAIAWIFIIAVFVPNSPLAFNSFGFDSGPALERNALMPVKGETIVLGKNLAFAILCLLHITPLILLTYWRLGLSSAALGVVVAASTAAAYLTWGNWMSLSLPFKMHPYRFAPSTGALPEIMAGLFFGCLPGVLVIYLVRSTNLGKIFLALLVLLPIGLLYLLVTFRSGRRFERQRERLALTLGLR